MNKVAVVQKAVADMSPCKMCGASVHESCKEVPQLPLVECPYYKRYNLNMEPTRG